MVIQNITVKAELGIAQEFYAWAKECVLYPVEGTVMDSRIFRLMNTDTTDGITFCLQHYFSDLSSYNSHVISGDKTFREDLSGRFGDKLVVFASVLKEV